MQLEKKIHAEISKVSAATSLVAWPLVTSRTITLSGRSARLRLEASVWDGLDEVARREGRAVTDLCAELDARRATDTPLTTAIRAFVLGYFREASAY
ncbi:MAG TPA: ribbon-helix-helix domain-containing protein [Azospirillum sp.]|nr:ribbon-helix-helix domain-containing protein [Azospirillum sp.]